MNLCYAWTAVLCANANGLVQRVLGFPIFYYQVGSDPAHILSPWQVMAIQPTTREFGEISKNVYTYYVFIYLPLF